MDYAIIRFKLVYPIWIVFGGTLAINFWIEWIKTKRYFWAAVFATLFCMLGIASEIALLPRVFDTIGFIPKFVSATYTLITTIVGAVLISATVVIFVNGIKNGKHESTN